MRRRTAPKGSTGALGTSAWTHSPFNADGLIRNGKKHSLKSSHSQNFLEQDVGQPRPSSFSAAKGALPHFSHSSTWHRAHAPASGSPHPRLGQAGRHCRAHAPPGRDVHLCSRRTAAQSPRCSPASQVPEHHCAPHPQSHVPAAPLRILKATCSPRGSDCERGFVVAVQGSQEGPSRKSSIYASHPKPRLARRLSARCAAESGARGIPRLPLKVPHAPGSSETPSGASEGAGVGGQRLGDFDPVPGTGARTAACRPLLSPARMETRRLRTAL